MTEPSSDPWASLADELGVDVPKEPSPPPGAPQTENTAPLHPVERTSHAPPPKKPADWHALAGALGIEIPPEAEPLAPRKDPVAELFGFPSPPPRTREQEEEERRQRSERRAAYEQEEDELASWEGAVDRGPSEQQTERPARDSSDEPETLDARDRFESRAPRSDEGSRDRGRRRRRGGRGRSRDDDRGSRHQESRRPYRSESQARASEEQDFGAQPEDIESLEDRGERGAEVDEDRTRHEDQPRRRRRRGRRGGQRHRPDRDGTGDRETASGATHEVPTDEDLDVDFESLGELGERAEEVDIDASTEPSAIPESEPLETESGEVESGEESHELRGGKGSVRDILTWKEAIGIIIDGNMQTRSRTPHTSHPQRGSRRGRGRHRGERN